MLVKPKQGLGWPKTSDDNASAASTPHFCRHPRVVVESHILTQTALGGSSEPSWAAMQAPAEVPVGFLLHELLYCDGVRGSAACRGLQFCCVRAAPTGRQQAAGSRRRCPLPGRPPTPGRARPPAPPQARQPWDIFTGLQAETRSLLFGFLHSNSGFTGSGAHPAHSAQCLRNTRAAGRRTGSSTPPAPRTPPCRRCRCSAQLPPSGKAAGNHHAAHAPCG